MATHLPMPKLGLTMETGTVLKWLKAEGEPVEKGEIILQIQTDKVEYEVESPGGGILLKTLVAEGDEVPCGENLAVIGEEGEEIGSLAAEVAPPAGDDEAGPPAEAVPEVSPSPAASGGRVLSSPAARRLARELGLDYRTLKGSGPGGRIVLADVEAAHAAGPPRPGAAEVPGGRTAVAARIPVAGMRKVIVERMASSWAAATRITLQAEVDLANLLAVREASRRAWEADLGVKVSINDLLLFYVARAVRRCPQVNVRLAGEEILQWEDVNLGVAVAVENGLMVPVIRGADGKSIDGIAREAHSLAEGARAGTLPLSALEGGTITVTNLGGYGVDHFSAILTPPEGAILSVGAARERAVVREGTVVSRITAFIGVNVDHRIVDGAPAAEFLATLKEMLEHPKVMPA